MTPHPLGRPLGLALIATSLVAATMPSSHREAPFVSEMPKVDATDFYAFTSYEPGRSDFVTFIANYQPLQAPYGGPNYFTMDPEARYEIHVDASGDALEDFTFRFAFNNRLRKLSVPVGPPGAEKMMPIPITQLGQVLPNDTSKLNVVESYTMEIVTGESGDAPGVQVANSANGRTSFSKPVDNIGTKTIPDYDAYAATTMYDIDLPGGFTGRMFVGQRKDSFVVNLGETFDLVNLSNPLGPVDGESDDLAGVNVTSIVVEVPKDFLAVSPPQGGPAVTPAVIGAWTTASLRRTRRLAVNPTFEVPALEEGSWTSVSRLGSPLVNELIIGLPDKDRFNASRPFDDGQFLDYVTNPVLPELIEILTGVDAPDIFPRDDLVATFLTGFAGINANGSFGEMLRLNIDVPPTPLASQSNLGLLGGDIAGFPNGRRPGDDVVDVALRVSMGALFDPVIVPNGQLPFTDGAFVDASFFDEDFPFLRTPLPGSPNP